MTLITDQSFATGVYRRRRPRAGQRHARDRRARRPAASSPWTPTPRSSEGDLVYTAGTTDSRLRRRYPPAILIGTVSRIDLGNGDLERRIHVKPAADMLQLDMVQVLTKPHADLDRAP